MVSLDLIQSSNTLIHTHLPHLTAVFAGGTNGVGETTLKQFAKHTPHPRAYIIGRSPAAGARIVAECTALNPSGTYVFLPPRDISLMRNVDAVCAEIKGREAVINLLFLTIGTLQIATKTEEGLNYPTALTLHARSRFITQLLPLLLPAQGLRRVISVYSATFEGPLSTPDFQGWTLGRIAGQAHLASLMTLMLAGHQERARGVSFVHAFPGAVEGGIARGEIGWLMRGLKTVWGWLGEWVHVPIEEAGGRHLWVGTSGRFPPAEGVGEGVPVGEGVEVARGVDGRVGSGVYSIDAKGESAGARVEGLLKKFREEGMVEWVRENIEADIERALASGGGGGGEIEI